MTKIIEILILGCFLSMLVSCVEEHEIAPTEESLPSTVANEAAQHKLPAAVQVSAPAKPLPDNVQLEGDWLFAMETTPKLLELPFHGTSLERLAGRLSDEEGRREIVYYGADSRAPQVLFKSDWLLPAVGAVNSAGEALVCVNRLVGAPTELTKGNVPDPANGIDLACRWRTGRGWSREYLIPRKGAALWLTDVVAVRGGTFRVTYGEDGTGQLVDDARVDEGIYRIQFDRGRLGKPELASRFERP
jgi:hypothetical protein